MMDANQVWDVDEAIANMGALAEVDPYWIEEPTHADDVLGHARIARAVRADPACHRRGRRQPGHLQAAPAGRRDRRRARSTPAGWAASTRCSSMLLMAAKFGVPVCPHAGGVGLCEYVQHLSIFDYLRVGTLAGGPDDRVRRPPARALRGPGHVLGRPLPAARPRPATASRSSRSRSPSSRSRTARHGGDGRTRRRDRPGPRGFRNSQENRDCRAPQRLLNTTACPGTGFRRVRIQDETRISIGQVPNAAYRLRGPRARPG